MFGFGIQDFILGMLVVFLIIGFVVWMARR